MANFRVEIANKIKGLITYYDLGYVLNNLESLITLPIPIKKPKMNSKQFDNNKQISNQTYLESRISFDNFNDEYNLRKSVFENIRKEYPDFCQGTKKFFSNDDYQDYLYLLKKCTKNLEKIINSFSNRTNDDYHELLLEKMDSISNLIDTEDISKLTFMQDSFVLSELEHVDYSKFEPQTKEDISKLEYNLNDRISKYNLFEKLYSSKNIIGLKPLKNSSKNER